MSFKVKGKVKEILGTEAVGQNGTLKNTVIVTTRDGEYDTDIAIDFMKEKADLVDSKVKVGDEVEIDFNLRSNQASGGRWFTNANGWKFSVIKPSDGAAF
jgi:hypothetical protein